MRRHGEIAPINGSLPIFRSFATSPHERGARRCMTLHDLRHWQFDGAMIR
jgi:hypothetical protein